MKSPLHKWFGHIDTSKISFFIRSVFLVATFFFFALLILSWVSVTLVPYIEYMLDIFGYKSITESELLSSSTNILLISITGVYVVYTGTLVVENKRATEQNENSRKIAHIERRLEKFYYPLHKLLNPLHPITVGNVVDAVYPYQYLATDETKKLFMDHLVARNRKDSVAILEKHATHSELKEAVNSDIDTLIAELNKLT